MSKPQQPSFKFLSGFRLDFVIDFLQHSQLLRVLRANVASEIATVIPLAIVRQHFTQPQAT